MSEVHLTLFRTVHDQGPELTRTSRRLRHARCNGRRVQLKTFVEEVQKFVVNGVAGAAAARPVPKHREYPMALHCFNNRYEIRIAGEQDRALDLPRRGKLDHVHA